MNHQEKITLTVRIQRVAQALVHDPEVSDETREQARDTAVAAHGVLSRLQTRSG